jgi:hypothetical protein
MIPFFRFYVVRTPLVARSRRREALKRPLQTWLTMKAKFKIASFPHRQGHASETVCIPIPATGPPHLGHVFSGVTAFATIRYPARRMRVAPQL